MWNEPNEVSLDALPIPTKSLCECVLTLHFCFLCRNSKCLQASCKLVAFCQQKAKLSWSYKRNVLDNDIKKTFVFLSLLSAMFTTLFSFSFSCPIFHIPLSQAGKYSLFMPECCRPRFLRMTGSVPRKLLSVAEYNSLSAPTKSIALVSCIFCYFVRSTTFKWPTTREGLRFWEETQRSVELFRLKWINARLNRTSGPSLQIVPTQNRDMLQEQFVELFKLPVERQKHCSVQTPVREQHELTLCWIRIFWNLIFNSLYFSKTLSNLEQE